MDTPVVLRRKHSDLIAGRGEASRRELILLRDHPSDWPHHPDKTNHSEFPNDLNSPGVCFIYPPQSPLLGEREALIKNLSRRKSINLT